MGGKQGSLEQGMSNEEQLVLNKEKTDKRVTKECQREEKQLQKELAKSWSDTYIREKLQSAEKIFQTKTFIEAIQSLGSAYILPLQEALRRMGYYKGESTGLYGGKYGSTYQAVKAFQEKRNKDNTKDTIIPDGWAGLKTLKRILTQNQLQQKLKNHRKPANKRIEKPKYTNKIEMSPTITKSQQTVQEQPKPPKTVEQTPNTINTIQNPAIKAMYTKMQQYEYQPQRDISLVVNPEEQKMYMISNGIIQTTYTISTGKNGLGNEAGKGRTSTGVLKITNVEGRDKKKGYVLNGKNNPKDQITSRKIILTGLENTNKNALNRGIMIHGTPQEELLGLPVSHGCIRMKNDDVIALGEKINQRQQQGKQVFVGVIDTTVPQNLRSTNTTANKTDNI